MTEKNIESITLVLKDNTEILLEKGKANPKLSIIKEMGNIEDLSLRNDNELIMAINGKNFLCKVKESYDLFKIWGKSFRNAGKNIVESFKLDIISCSNEARSKEQDQATLKREKKKLKDLNSRLKNKEKTMTEVFNKLKAIYYDGVNQKPETYINILDKMKLEIDALKNEIKTQEKNVKEASLDQALSSTDLKKCKKSAKAQKKVDKYANLIQGDIVFEEKIKNAPVMKGFIDKADKIDKDGTEWQFNMIKSIKVIRDWEAEGFNNREAQLWDMYGFTLDEAIKYRDEGLSPIRARSEKMSQSKVKGVALINTINKEMLSILGKLNLVFNEDLEEWKKKFIEEFLSEEDLKSKTPEKAWLEKYKITLLAEIQEWHIYSFTLEEAISWKAQGFTPAGIRRQQGKIPAKINAILKDTLFSKKDKESKEDSEKRAEEYVRREDLFQNISNIWFESEKKKVDSFLKENLEKLLGLPLSEKVLKLLIELEQNIIKLLEKHKITNCREILKIIKKDIKNAYVSDFPLYFTIDKDIKEKGKCANVEKCDLELGKQIEEMIQKTKEKIIKLL